MPTPNLIHPVPVTFELIDEDISVYDENAREPINQAVRTGEGLRTGNRVTIQCQVSFYFASAKQGYPLFNREGVEEETSGYIAVRYKDLLKEGLITKSSTDIFSGMKLKRGTRVVQVGSQPMNYYILGYKQFGHYPRLNQTMVQLNFSDREPTHREGDL